MIANGKIIKLHFRYGIKNYFKPHKWKKENNKEIRLYYV